MEFPLQWRYYPELFCIFTWIASVSYPGLTLYPILGSSVFPPGLPLYHILDSYVFPPGLPLYPTLDSSVSSPGLPCILPFTAPLSYPGLFYLDPILFCVFTRIALVSYPGLFCVSTSISPVSYPELLLYPFLDSSVFSPGLPCLFPWLACIPVSPPYWEYDEGVSTAVVAGSSLPFRTVRSAIYISRIFRATLHIPPSKPLPPTSVIKYLGTEREVAVLNILHCPSQRGLNDV